MPASECGHSSERAHPVEHDGDGFHQAVMAAVVDWPSQSLLRFGMHDLPI